MDKIDSKRGSRSGRGRGGCPVLAFQRMVSGKYKIRILWDLKDGRLRYSEIRRGLLRGAVVAEVADRDAGGAFACEAEGDRAADSA